MPARLPGGRESDGKCSSYTPDFWVRSTIPPQARLCVGMVVLKARDKIHRQLQGNLKVVGPASRLTVIEVQTATFRLTRAE